MTSDSAPGHADTTENLSGRLAGLISEQRELATLEATADAARRQLAAANAREAVAGKAASAAAARARIARDTEAQAQKQVGRLVEAAYRYGPTESLTSLSLVLDPQSADEYLHNAHETQRIIVSGAEVLARASTASQQAQAAESQATAAADALTAARRTAEQSVHQATQAASAANARLNQLGARFDALLNADAAQPGLPPSSPESFADPAAGPAGLLGVAAAPYSTDIADSVLSFALAQVGKPYVWGATGPGAFDCSGLAMTAYRAAGVDLPHFAAFQYAASHPLGFDQLRPGDLLFWATDRSNPGTIYHEAIYLGGSLMVQAPESHWNVMVSNIWMWGPIQFFARPY